MKLPDWLEPLKPREEKLRAGNGLIPKKDGWYKTFDGKTRYICKPCPVGDAAKMLPDRIDEIRRKPVGRSPAIQTTADLTLNSLANQYQAWLWQRLTTGSPKKLARRTYDDAIHTINEFVACAGPNKLADAIGPLEFSEYTKQHLAGRQPTSIRRKMIYIEAFANWAAPGRRKAGILKQPWHYGADFVKPRADQMSLSAADSDKAYTPEQLRAAFLRVRRHPMMRAAGWLALCGAFGPKDLGLLPQALVDLETGMVRFARGKTGVGRQCWLPAAARLAIKQYVESRPKAVDADAEPLLFRTSAGRATYRDATGEDFGNRVDTIGWTWRKMTGLPLSGLRSTFATLADDWPDQRAVDVAMGHIAGTATRSTRVQNYAKGFDPDRSKRLVAAVVVRAFGRKTPEPASTAGQPSATQPAAAPVAKPAKRQRRRGRSSTGAPKTPASARRSRGARRT